MINPTLNRCFPLFWCAILVQLFCFAHLNAQTVIGGDTIDQSAILDIQDTAKGVLLSRLTTTQRNAIPKPAFGLLILNTTRKCLEANIGSPDTPDWRCLTTGIQKISDLDTAYWNRKLGAGDTLSLSARINAKLSPGDTLSLSNRIDRKLSSFIESDPVFNSSIAKGISGADTLYWNRKLDVGDTLSLSSRINAKLNPVDTLSLSNRIDGKLSSYTESDPVFNSSIAKGITGADTLYWNRKLGAGDTLSLSARINAKLSPVDTVSLSNRIDGKLSSYIESDPVFNSSIAKGITRADTLYWNRKLSARDTISLSSRIDSKVGLPQSGNTPGSMLYWSGTEWVKVSPGLPGQTLALSNEGFPIWVDSDLVISSKKVKNIPQGSFFMGCISTDPDCEDNEKPLHKVTLSAFQIGETEVTQAEWQSLMGDNPSFFSNPSCPQCPVERISWFDAIVYCNRLSEAKGLTPCYYSDAEFSQIFGKNGYNWVLPNTGEVYWNESAKGFRLPTEAEWEFSARGGNSSNLYSGSNDINLVAWYSNNSGSKTNSVKAKFPNGYGFDLYDFSGNVWEWCWDWFGSYNSLEQENPSGPSIGVERILRGCSWLNFPKQCRLSYRFPFNPANRFFDVGFRLAKSL